MSIISSNHIDLKSNSIWGLYNVTSYLQERWDLFLSGRLVMIDGSFGSYFTRDPEAGTLTVHQIKLSYWIKADFGQNYCMLDRIFSTYEYFVYDPKKTTVEDIKKYLYSECEKEAAFRHIDPREMAFSAIFDPKDYIKFES